jgi:hypothetical protein
MKEGNAKFQQMKKELEYKTTTLALRTNDKTGKDRINKTVLDIEALENDEIAD